jgi:hypothetical protein
MDAKVAGMTNNRQISKSVIPSIKVDMVDFKTTFSNYTTTAFVWKTIKRLFSVFNVGVSLILTLIATVCKVMTIPVIVQKIFFTCFTDAYGVLSLFKEKITLFATKDNVFVLIVNNVVFFAVFACIYFRDALKTACACRAAKKSFASISRKFLITSFAYFYHDSTISESVHLIKYSYFKKEVCYGVL